MNNTDKQTEFLYARLSDLRDGANSGIFRASAFFTPHELVLVKRWISAQGCASNARIYGGYEYAERARVYFLPDFMADDISENIGELVRAYGYDDPTVLLKISGSGFRKLSHRDYMGTVLSLGIERDSVGDIVVGSDSEAYIFCDRKVSGYIISELKKIARDAARVQEVSIPEGNFGERRYELLRDTVASLRFDAVVASCTNMSRDAAKKTVVSGFCELNYEQITSPDFEVNAGDVFSIRGKGKFRLRSVDGENARGRLRISVEKYI